MRMHARGCVFRVNTDKERHVKTALETDYDITRRKEPIKYTLGELSVESDPGRG